MIIRLCRGRLYCMPARARSAASKLTLDGKLLKVFNVKRAVTSRAFVIKAPGARPGRKVGLAMEIGQPFHRDGNLVLFSQFGPKLRFPDDVTNDQYFAWLDRTTAEIGKIVPGTEIIEKPADREEPRRNTGVYYDTEDFVLLKSHMVLRTTSNPKTHAFCAFKYGADENQTRRDHRHIFEGDEKRTIQFGPSSDAAVEVVRSLLRRTDIRHPGTFLKEATGLGPDDLRPAVMIAQYRYTFYVLIDGHDALRCSLDRADVSSLRQMGRHVEPKFFSEIELPIFPRISQATLRDERTVRLMKVLSESLGDAFGAEHIHDSKYRRAARILGLLDSDEQ